MHSGDKLRRCPGGSVTYKANAELLQWESWQQYMSCQSLKKWLSLHRSDTFYSSVSWQQHLVCTVWFEESIWCWKRLLVWFMRRLQNDEVFTSNKSSIYHLLTDTLTKATARPYSFIISTIKYLPWLHCFAVFGTSRQNIYVGIFFFFTLVRLLSEEGAVCPDDLLNFMWTVEP